MTDALLRNKVNILKINLFSLCFRELHETGSDVYVYSYMGTMMLDVTISF